MKRLLGIGSFTLLVLTVALAFPLRVTATPASEVPAGTKFIVELRDKLEAKKVKVGKKFDARTLEALRASDGSTIPAGKKLKGRVSFVEFNKMALRFEEIDTGRGKVPIVATVSGVVGERGVQPVTGEEGEIKSKSSRARGTLAGAAIGAGVGAGVGATQGGKKGAAIGAGVGAAGGAVVGALIGGSDLTLDKGTRLELELDRPLTFELKR